MKDKKRTSIFGKGFFLYTALFFAVFLLAYGYLLVGGVLGVPEFTYAGF